MKENKKKLIIIGIDGANFDVLNPFFEKNLLPNLAKFKNRATLKSVLPPATAVAWASFSTGNNPGKTEIYDFTIVEEDSWKINFLNRTRLCGKPLWKYLDQGGVKSCFINIPVTYPIDEINGVIISGIETPSTLHNYVHPIELKSDLKKLGYEIEVSGLKNKKEDIVEEALSIFNKRLKTAKFLLEKNFDFFIVLFRASDIVKHYAWGKKTVEEVYKKIDEFVGEVRKDKDAEVVVISDHGFEKINYAFNTNAWLEREGYLKSNLKKSMLSTFGIKRKRIYWILEKLNLNFLTKMVPRSLGKKIPADKINFEEAILTNSVDFTKTKAIAKRAIKTAQIFLNKIKRGGIVDTEEEAPLKKEIKEKLEKYFQEQGIKAIVKTKEEIYGPQAKYAPDITLYLEEKGYDTYNFLSADKKLWVPPTEKQEAEHNLYGVIFTDLDLNLEDAKLIDITPTILDYFGIEKGQFDGKSLWRKKDF